MEEQKIKDLITEVFNLGQLVEKVTNLDKRLTVHTEADDKHFNGLYNAVRELPDKLRKEIEGDMKERYVTQKEFEVFVAQIKGLRWFVAGIIFITQFVTWGLMVWVNVSRLS